MNMSTFNDVEYLNGSYFDIKYILNGMGFGISGRHPWQYDIQVTPPHTHTGDR